VVFVDGDHSVDANELILLLDSIATGVELVVGSRVVAKQQNSALGTHQRFGNLLASRLIRFIWGAPITDLGRWKCK